MFTRDTVVYDRVKPRAEVVNDGTVLYLLLYLLTVVYDGSRVLMARKSRAGQGMNSVSSSSSPTRLRTRQNHPITTPPSKTFPHEPCAPLLPDLDPFPLTRKTLSDRLLFELLCVCPAVGGAPLRRTSKFPMLPGFLIVCKLNHALTSSKGPALLPVSTGLDCRRIQTPSPVQGTDQGVTACAWGPIAQHHGNPQGQDEDCRGRRISIRNRGYVSKADRETTFLRSDKAFRGRRTRPAGAHGCGFRAGYPIDFTREITYAHTFM